VDPRRKRTLRLVAALSAAVLLASGLVYVSFSAGDAALTPSEALAAGEGGGTYELTGRVVDDSIERQGDGLLFEIQDREGDGGTVPVDYSGLVPDPFREGREVIVTGRMVDGTFMAQKDELVTKCPSKFKDEGMPS
jgi:cytochrome c-type biogenesis protein CcmE